MTATARKLDLAFALRALKAEGINVHTAPMTEITDALIEAVERARPSWDDDRVLEEAEKLAAAVVA